MMCIIHQQVHWVGADAGRSDFAVDEEGQAPPSVSTNLEEVNDPDMFDTPDEEEEQEEAVAEGDWRPFPFNRYSSNRRELHI